MNKFFSYILGAIILLAILGFLLYVFVFYILPIILVVGLVFYVLRSVYRFIYQQRNSTDDFLALAFMPLGYITYRCTSPDDLKSIYHDNVMEMFNIRKDRYARAREFIVKGARASSEEIRDTVSKFRQYWDREPSRNRLFLAQIRALLIDRILTPKEIGVFHEAASWYGYSREEAQTILDSLLKANNFQYDSSSGCYTAYTFGFGFGGSGGGEDQGYGQQDQQSGGSYGSGFSSGNDLDEAYRVLGISASTSDHDAKRAYRTLMSRYHPDKAMAQGLGDDEVRRYTELSQKIGRAWDTVKKYRHIK